MRVLILVGGETHVAMLAEDVVENCVYAVVGTAVTYSDTIALGAEHGPNIALVDLNLRDGFTGPEVGTTLAERLGVKILFVTGDVEGAPVRHAGGVGALAKPYSPRELKIRLHELAAVSLGAVSELTGDGAASGS